MSDACELPSAPHVKLQSARGGESMVTFSLFVALDSTAASTVNALPRRLPELLLNADLPAVPLVGQPGGTGMGNM